MARNFCLLILLCSILNAHEGFWFSYQISTQNQIMTNEERNISPLMVYDENSKREFLCKIYKKKSLKDSTHSYLISNYEELLDCFYSSNSRLTSNLQSELKGMLAQSELTILPVKFTVDFKDDFANIYLLR